jgi:hypothetical protein
MGLASEISPPKVTTLTIMSWVGASANAEIVRAVGCAPGMPASRPSPGKAISPDEEFRHPVATASPAERAASGSKCFKACKGNAFLTKTPSTFCTLDAGDTS